MLKATPSRNVPQTPAPATSKWGQNGEEPAALLRVGTGQKALRAVGGRFFKLWESKRKTDRQEHTSGSSQNKGTEKLQRRAARSPLEVGGRGRGKGQTQPQRSHPLPPGKQAPVPVERLPETRPAAARTGAAEGKGAARPWRERQASGCPARTRRVLPTHSDICLQGPALPAAGLN